jgi:hypothetical protein
LIISAAASHFSALHSLRLAVWLSFGCCSPKPGLMRSNLAPRLEFCNFVANDAEACIDRNAAMRSPGERSYPTVKFQRSAPLVLGNQVGSVSSR